MSDTSQVPGGEQTQIEKIIQRVITDPEFKMRLIADADAVLAEYQLTEVQRLLIKTLDAGDLEKLTPENVKEYFSADAAVYTPDLDSDLDDADFESSFREDDKGEGKQ